MTMNVYLESVDLETKDHDSASGLTTIMILIPRDERSRLGI